MKEAAGFVFIDGSGPQIITSGSLLTRQSSKRGHAGGLVSCLPLSPTSCTGQRDEHDKLAPKWLLEIKNKYVHKKKKEIYSYDRILQFGTEMSMSEESNSNRN